MLKWVAAAVWLHYYQGYLNWSNLPLFCFNCYKTYTIHQHHIKSFSDVADGGIESRIDKANDLPDDQVTTIHIANFYICQHLTLTTTLMLYGHPGRVCLIQTVKTNTWWGVNIHAHTLTQDTSKNSHWDKQWTSSNVDNAVNSSHQNNTQFQFYLNMKNCWK